MIDSHPLKSLPFSWQTLVRPMLLISLALHGLLLLLPIPSKSKETPPKQEEKIKITQLPDTPPSSASPVSSPKPQASVTPKIAPPVHRQEAPIQPLTPRPKPLATPIDQASPKPQPQVTPKPAPSEAKQPSSTDFPIFYPGSQKGSLGLLSADQDKSARYTADSIETVDSYFQKDLQSKGLSLTPETQYQQTGTKIYEIAQSSGKSKYLYLLPNGTNVVILVASKLDDPKNLVKAQASNPDEEAFDGVWGTLNGESSPIGNTSTPEITDLPQTLITTFADSSDQSLFDEKYTPRIGTASFSKVHTPEEVTNLLKATFQAQGFDFAESNKSKNISVYKATKGSFTSYISIVPTKNGAGVITSQNPPGQ